MKALFYRLMKTYRNIFFLLIFFLSLQITYAKDSLSLGLGGSFLSYPSYLGSKKQNTLFVPIPYIKYRSKYLNIDKDKVYNEIYKKNKFSLEFSLVGTLPSKNDGSLREGMPNLDAVFEIGPKLMYNIVKKGNMESNIEIPIRAAFSIGSKIDYEGYFSSLDFSSKIRLYKDFDFIFTSGISYSSKKLNNYYYEVKKEYVTANREEYHSKSGYSTFHNSIALTRKSDKFGFGVFLKHYNLNNSVFLDSPLIETKNSFFYGTALIYFF